MAPQSATTQEVRTTKRTARGTNAARTRRRRSSPKRRSRSTEIGELERIIRNLESQIAHFTSGSTIRSTVSGATNQVGQAVTKASSHMGDMAADMLTDVAGHLRSGANSATSVARAGTGVLRTISNELERRPYMTVAVALGIGFLAGLVGRRDEAA